MHRQRGGRKGGQESGSSVQSTHRGAPGKASQVCGSEPKVSVVCLVLLLLLLLVACGPSRRRRQLPRGEGAGAVAAATHIAATMRVCADGAALAKAANAGRHA